jgi:hypothetical protein
MPAVCRSKSGTMTTTWSSRAIACMRSVVGPGNWLRQVEAIALLRLAEVLGVKKLFQTDDLRPAGGGITHEPFGAGDIGRHVSGRVILDEPDGEGEFVTSGLQSKV